MVRPGQKLIGGQPASRAPARAESAADSASTRRSPPPTQHRRGGVDCRRTGAAKSAARGPDAAHRRLQLRRWVTAVVAEAGSAAVAAADPASAGLATAAVCSAAAAARLGLLALGPRPVALLSAARLASARAASPVAEATALTIPAAATAVARWLAAVRRSRPVHRARRPPTTAVWYRRRHPAPRHPQAMSLTVHSG